MLPDDVFRTQFQATAAALVRWAESIRDVADAAVGEGHGFWKLTVAPHVPGACPFEMIVRSGQRLDISVAGETYEDRPMPAVERLLGVAEAIGEGRVVERHWRSQMTGTLVLVETIVRPGAGEAWCERRMLRPLVPAPDKEGQAEFCDRHFLPYRRLSGI